MKQDTYSELLDLMRSAGRSSEGGSAVRLRLGKVLSAVPLSVDVAGTIQEAGRFYLSRHLMEGREERLSLDCAGVSAALAVSASCPQGFHSHMDVSSGTLRSSLCTATQVEPPLKEGDVVLLLTEDDQTFFLVDKVVRAG